MPAARGRECRRANRSCSRSAARTNRSKTAFMSTTKALASSPPACASSPAVVTTAGQATPSVAFVQPGPHRLGYLTAADDEAADAVELLVQPGERTPRCLVAQPQPAEHVDSAAQQPVFQNVGGELVGTSRTLRSCGSGTERRGARGAPPIDWSGAPAAHQPRPLVLVASSSNRRCVARQPRLS